MGLCNKVTCLKSCPRFHKKKGFFRIFSAPQELNHVKISKSLKFGTVQDRQAFTKMVQQRCRCIGQRCGGSWVRTTQNCSTCCRFLADASAQLALLRRAEPCFVSTSAGLAGRVRPGAPTAR